jgi:beta-lactam-binding protein with PASTA domain
MIQQQCSAHISIDEKQSTYAETPSSIGKNYSEAERYCKEKGLNFEIPTDQTFLASISNEAENKGVIGR